MNKINLNHLSIAVALYEKRSVTRAAKMLGMSQPSVSNALSNLRKIFEDDLFIKTARGMVPTPRAKLLVESARGVLMNLNQDVLAETTFDPSTTTSTLTFALSEVGELLISPKICKALRTLAPNTRLRSISPMQDELLHGMVSGEIDVAIGKFVELERSGYHRLRLRQSDIVCLMRADRPIQGKSLSLQQYRTLRHLEVGAGGRIGRHWERLFRGTNAKRNIVVATTYVIALPEIIQSYDVVATITRAQGDYFCKTHKGLKMVEVPFLKGKAEVNLYWHRKLQNQPKNQWIRNMIKDLFKKEPELRTYRAPLESPREDQSKT